MTTDIWCERQDQCDDTHYCDKVMSRCLSCAWLCDPKRDTQSECCKECPDWADHCPKTPTKAHAKTITLTTTTTDKPKEQEKKKHQKKPKKHIRKKNRKNKTKSTPIAFEQTPSWTSSVPKLASSSVYLSEVSMSTASSAGVLSVQAVSTPLVLPVSGVLLSYDTLMYCLIAGMLTLIITILIICVVCWRARGKQRRPVKDSSIEEYNGPLLPFTQPSVVLITSAEACSSPHTALATSLAPPIGETKAMGQALSADVQGVRVVPLIIGQVHSSVPMVVNSGCLEMLPGE